MFPLSPNVAMSQSLCVTQTVRFRRAGLADQESHMRRVHHMHHCPTHNSLKIYGRTVRSRSRLRRRRPQCLKTQPKLQEQSSRRKPTDYSWPTRAWILALS